MDEQAAPPEDLDRLVAIYLNDHLAGSTAGLELVRRAAGAYAGTELGSFLASLETEIAEDREALLRIMQAAGAGTDRVKTSAAWLGEKAGRLKFNGRLRSRSPLTPLVELEGLTMGIHGKLLLWRTLHEHRPPGSDAVDLDELITRAERQLADIERHRLAAGAALRSGG